MLGLITTLAGPFIGLIGSGFTAFMKEREAKAALAAKEIDHKHELALLDKQASLRTVEAENERAIALVDAAARQAEKSYEADAAVPPGHAWAADIKSLARPFFTLLLILLTGGIYFTFDPDNTVNTIQEHIVYSILFLTEVAVAWWFGDRARDSSRRARPA